MESGVYTVSQLHEQMKTLVDDDLPVYHEKYLKQALERHYGNIIFITNQEHRKDVVCFRNCTADIIRDYHKKMETGIEDEKKKAIIKMAASLIINDIKCLNFSKEEFPSLIEMTSHYELPESLELLLTCLIPHSSVRRNVAGQNIISSQRPRSSNICDGWLGRKKVSKDLTVTPQLTISCDREVFLANEKNKGALIMIMSTEMANHNIVVCQAKDDADTLIVKTAMDLVT